MTFGPSAGAAAPLSCASRIGFDPPGKPKRFSPRFARLPFPFQLAKEGVALVKAGVQNEYTYSLLGLIMPTTIRLEASIEQRLDRLAAQTGRTKAFYLRELIMRGLDELETFYLASDTMERVRKGQEPIHSADQVRKDLGLAE